jgi:hypothetical protein
MGDATQLSRLVLALAAAVVNAVAPYPAFAQHVAVIVNGAPITTYDIDQRTKEVRDKMLAQDPDPGQALPRTVAPPRDDRDQE